MTRSSLKVKYISTVHPHCRDGLLKSDIKDVKEDESVFHMSCHQNDKTYVNTASARPP